MSCDKPVAAIGAVGQGASESTLETRSSEMTFSILRGQAQAFWFSVFSEKQLSCFAMYMFTLI